LADRCCCDRRSQAATGHRQGLYPRRPPHPGRPSSLCDVVAAAIVDRELQQVTARGLTQEGLPIRGGLRLCVIPIVGCCCGDRRSRPATGHRQGLYPRRPPIRGGLRL